jgi:Ca2+-binding RTX toxin-like protein
MTQSKTVLTKLALSGALLMAACGGESTTAPRTYTFDATGFDGLETQTLGLVAGGCPTTAASGMNPAFMTLTVGAGETLYLFKRATDSRVVANATLDGMLASAECTAAVTTQIKIVGTGIGHKVFLDYANGYFSMGTSLTVDTALSIRLGGMGTTDTVTLRGTGLVDLWNFGTTGATTTQQSAANLNFGATAPNDKFVDITFGPTGATPVNNIRTLDPLDVKVSTGAGNDVITGQNAGLAATTTGFSVPLTVWAGDDNDSIASGAALGTGLFNYLDGGKGSDTFTQQAVKVADHIYGGTDSGNADVDLVDYSVRTAALAITLGTTYSTVADADDGESGEADHIDGTVENVTGGTANDTIDAALATTIVHTLRGGPGLPDVSTGNDKLIGSSLVDTLYGGAGDDDLIGGAGNDTIIGGPNSDTIDFGDHTAAVTVNLDGTTGGTTGSEVDIFNVTGSVDIENIRGGTMGDSLTGNGNANIIWGGAGADTILGGGGSDSLYGQGGIDDIDGEAGDDVIAGGDQADVLKGGAGNDLVDATEEGSAAADTSIDCGADNDVVLFDSADGALDGTHTCEIVL